MEIRPERADDVAAVQEVETAAFGDHGVKVAALVDSLRGPDTLSLVAVDDSGVTGHVMFSPALLDAVERAVDVVTLSPLAVRPDRQRQGIGGELIRHGLAELDRRGVPVVFLEGDPGYYSRHGFVASEDFRRPSLRIPTAGFQSYRLSAYEPWMTGTFVYRDVFWEHDCVGLR